MGSVQSMMGSGLSGAAATNIHGGTVATAITAAGTSTTDATALSADVNLVGTTASGTGVRLPDIEVGSIVYVSNGGASTLLVYPFTGGQMNGNTANSGVVIGIKKGGLFLRANSGNWIGIGDIA